MAVESREETTRARVDDARSGAGADTARGYEIAPYALVARARVGREHWPGLWFSWLSLKGHVASFHYVQGTYHFATRKGDDMEAIFVIAWETADAIGAWFEQGYTIEDMFTSMGLTSEDYEVTLMRDLS